MRWIVSASLLVAACGRVGFDDHARGEADAPVSDAQLAVPQLVALSQTTINTGPDVTQLELAIPAVGADHLLVVAVTHHGGQQVASIVDDLGRTLLPTGARASDGIASELWYGPASAGATRVLLTNDRAGHLDLWVAEFSGVGGPPDAITTNCVEYPPNIAGAAITTSIANELVVSVTMCAAPLYVEEMLPPFTGFPQQTGNTAGFIVATTPGSYGATFSIDQGEGQPAMTCSSTARWRPDIVQM